MHECGEWIEIKPKIGLSSEYARGKIENSIFVMSQCLFPSEFVEGD